MGLVGTRAAVAIARSSRRTRETRLSTAVNVGAPIVNPCAVLEAVEIGGTTVRLATLHNFDLIRTKDLRVGDVVLLKRAGDVIPQVIGPVPEKRDANDPPKKIRIPTKCPSCGTKVERDEEEVAIYCPNVACPDRQLEAMVHFASRGAMDIRGLSYARIEQLIAASLVHDVADLYSLTAEHSRARPVRRHVREEPRDAIEASRRAALGALRTRASGKWGRPRRRDCAPFRFVDAICRA